MNPHFAVTVATVLFCTQVFAAPRVFPPQPPLRDPIADAKVAQAMATQPDSAFEPLMWARLGELEKAVAITNSIQTPQLPSTWREGLTQKIYMTVARRRALLGDIKGAQELLPKIKNSYDRVDGSLLIGYAALRQRNLPEVRKWADKAAKELEQWQRRNKGTDLQASSDADGEIKRLRKSAGSKNKSGKLLDEIESPVTAGMTDAEILAPKSSIREAIIKYGQIEHIDDLLNAGRPQVALRLAQLPSHLGGAYQILRLQAVAKYYLARRRWIQARPIVASMQQHLSKMESSNVPYGSMETTWRAAYIPVTGTLQTLGDTNTAQKLLQQLKQKHKEGLNGEVDLFTTIAPLLTLEGRNLSPFLSPTIEKKPLKPLTNAQRNNIAVKIYALLQKNPRTGLRFTMLGTLFRSQSSANEISAAQKTLTQLEKFLGPETKSGGSLEAFGYLQQIAAEWRNLGEEMHAQAIIGQLLREGADVSGYGFVEEEVKYNLSLPKSERKNTFPFELARYAARYRSSSDVPTWILQLPIDEQSTALGSYAQEITSGYFEKAEIKFLERGRH